MTIPHERLDELRRAIDSVATWRPPEAVEPLDFRELDGREPPPRRFTWKNWTPVGTVTSLYGDGGAGKSMLMQQAATHIALGLQFLGEDTDGRPVLCIFAEEDRAELWRRQLRICRALGIRIRDLEGRLFLDARAGKPNVLVKFAPDGTLVPGEFAEPLRRAVEELRPGTLVLDNIAQIFAGNENDRAQVTQFINYRTSLAIEFECDIVIVGHTAKSADSKYSGSTAWNAAVRCRLMLHVDPQTKALKRERIKSNYARHAEVELMWSDGIIRPALPELATMADRLALEERKAQIRSEFVKALETLRARGLAASANEQAPTYAPRLMHKHGLMTEFSRREIERAMIELMEQNRIIANVPVCRASNRHVRHGLGLVEWQPARGHGNVAGV